MITGSAAGVYDPLPWIAPLKDFLVSAKGRAKLVGVCFGHQVMAEAFGGKVIKSPKGWGLGLHAYEVVRREGWMDEARTRCTRVGTFPRSETVVRSGLSAKSCASRRSELVPMRAPRRTPSGWLGSDAWGERMRQS